MTKPLVIDPRAEREIADAYKWYGRRDRQAATRYRVEVNQAMDRIGQLPESFPPYMHGTRMCLLKKFPYLVVFREYPDHLFVVAVAHGRQRPGYWRKRLE